MPIFVPIALLLLGAGTLTAAVAVARRCLKDRGEASALIAHAAAMLVRPRRILLLGPERSGKSTLMRQAVALWEEEETERHRSVSALDPSVPYQPTRGLVIRNLALPTRQGEAHVQLCDAGGSLACRRQWVSLIRDADVSALVFVADVSDESDDTFGLFAQLANAPWARQSHILIALTHIDGPTRSDAAAREAQYRARVGETYFGAGTTASGQALSCHALNCHDADAARRLLLAAGSAARLDDADAETRT